MNVLHDIRFAIRLLARDRWFTAAATTALALGIGMNATVFTLGSGVALGLTIDGRQVAGEQPPQVTRVAVGSQYFETLGLTLTRGRAFADADGTAGHEVGIVNQRLVSMYFAGEDPLGRRIRLVPDTPTGLEPPAWMTIVGVSPTVRQRNLREPDPDPVV
jgi:putative ABC transport system permease protein